MTLLNSHINHNGAKILEFGFYGLNWEGILARLRCSFAFSK